MIRHRAGDGGIIRVLYVDDDEQNRAVAKTFLEKELDIKVETVDDATIALQRVRSGDLDVVVSDLMMVGMDGIELLKDIRSFGSDIPFIILSARRREEVVLKAFSEGADFYVQRGGGQRSQFIELAGKIRNSHLSRVRERELSRLMAATESSIDGIAIFDPDLNLSYANRSFLDTLGFSNLHDALGSHIETLFIPTDEGYADSVPIQDLEEKGHHLSRRVIATHQGRTVNVEVSVTSLADRGAISVVRDIGELLRKEDELKSLNERNAAILDSIPDRIILLDTTNELLISSGESETWSVMGIEPKRPDSNGLEANGDRLDRLMIKKIGEMRRGEHLRPFKYSRESDGELRHFEARMNLIDEGLSMIIERDITELHDAKSIAEENARKNEESKRLLESILQTQTEMICRFNSDTTLTYVNDSYCRYFRKSPKDIIGKRFLEFVPKLWHASILESISNLTPDDPILNYAHEVVRDDGAVGWQEWTDTAMFSPEGDLLFIQSVGRDITQVVMYQEEQDRQIHLKEVLINILSDFIRSQVDGYEQSVQDSLRQIGEFVGVDRCYIFEYDFRNKVCNNTYEWCDDGADTQIKNLQRVPLSLIKEWADRHRSAEAIHIPDVAACGNKDIRSLLEAQGVESLLTIPLMDNNGCKGFVGFDSVRKKRDFEPSEISLLRIYADMLVVLNSRMEAERDLRRVDELNRLLIDNYPDVVYATDLMGNIIHISENVEDILGYTPEEMRGMGLDFIVGPADGLFRNIDISHLEDKISRGDVDDVMNTPVEIMAKNGAIVKAETSNRLYKGRDGRWIFIGYAKRLQ